MFKELVLKNRSIRRFYEEIEMPLDLIKDLVELTRYTASGRNAQPLKYRIVNKLEVNDSVFKTLTWAGYLKDWNGPVIGERPSSYIIILHDLSISNNYYCDHGIAAQTILLGATEKGFGGCMIAVFNKRELSTILNLPEHLNIVLVIALGKPKEEVVIDDMLEGDVKYWRDQKKVHHVPKRSLEELIV